MTVRISFTTSEELSERLKTYASLFGQGEEVDNVSKVLSNLIAKHIPYLDEDAMDDDKQLAKHLLN